ncbi:acetyltransferase [Stachybotrys elegans]|uniref:Acetyltransferase n=1 Tax=Stachybotrys elegans TaxID=80388 RepID=A0A8K0SF30_9HYPO|nr:acetyltransferase [Stachybotrys elegans]
MPQQYLGEEAPEGEALRPTAEPLHGKYTSLVPYDSSHVDSLYRELFRPGTEHIWTWIPAQIPSEVTQTGAALDYLLSLSSSSESFFYAVLSAPASDPSAEALGLITHVNVAPEHRRIEVGVIFGSQLKQTRMATEAFYLMMQNTFENYGYTRFEWRANELNTASVAAAKRLGFQYEGILRNNLIVKGRYRNTVCCSVLKEEWPRVRGGFQKWLSPDNFDESGKQKLSLKECRET